MFLRRHRKEAGGEDYEYWSLVKTIRTARGPRHQIVARLGKLDGAQVRAARGWEEVDALLEGSAPSRQLSLVRLDSRILLPSLDRCLNRMLPNRGNVWKLSANQHGMK
jgi:hypothetical protein